jgi:hypothetical protein
LTLCTISDVVHNNNILCFEFSALNAEHKDRRLGDSVGRFLRPARFQIWRRTIIQRLQATSNVSPISPENHMGESRQYTTQLGAGLGMIQETFDLLRLWEPGEAPSVPFFMWNPLLRGVPLREARS